MGSLCLLQGISPTQELNQGLLHCRHIPLSYKGSPTKMEFGEMNIFAAAAAAKSLQSCLTLCYPIDGSPPGSPVPGILQARILERVAISFSEEDLNFCISREKKNRQ